MNEEEIECLLRIDGKNFNKDGTSLHDLIKVYEAIEGLFDSTYSNALRIERFNKEVRDGYKIIIKEAKIGSWESVLKIFIAVSPALFGTGLSPKDYLETIFVTYEFLKAVFTVKKENIPYTLTTNNNGNQVFINSGSGQQNVFTAPITINLINNGKDSLNDLQSIMDLFKSGSIENIKLNSSNINKEINISSNDKNLFDSDEIKSSETKEISAELYRFNKRSRTGKLHVDQGQSIPAGKYSFSINKNDIQNDIIVSMLKSNTTIVVREIFIDDPITNKKVLNSLEIVDI